MEWESFLIVPFPDLCLLVPSFTLHRFMYKRLEIQTQILLFDQSVFLSKANIMYKIMNNLAPRYLTEMLYMREILLIQIPV